MDKYSAPLRTQLVVVNPSNGGSDDALLMTSVSQPEIFRGGTWYRRNTLTSGVADEQFGFGLIDARNALFGRGAAK